MVRSHPRAVVGIVLAVVVGLAAWGVVALRGGHGRAPLASTTTVPATTVTTASSTTTSSTTSAGSTTSTAAPTVPTTARTTTTTRGSTTSTRAPSAAIAIRQGPTSRRVVALTFDAGSDAGWAAEILDTLAANGIKATFGVTGEWAAANPALVRRIAPAGHLVVNHSFDHASFTGRSTGTDPLTRAQRLDELARADAAIRAAAGVGTAPWFRPPFGDEDASVRADVGAAGYRYELLWTVDSLGWKGLAPDAVRQRCLDQAAPGAIYLFHVGEASTDHAALQPIIDGLRAAGYGFVTAAAMVAG